MVSSQIDPSMNPYSLRSLLRRTHGGRPGHPVGLHVCLNLLYFEFLCFSATFSTEKEILSRDNRNSRHTALETRNWAQKAIVLPKFHFWFQFYLKYPYFRAESGWYTTSVLAWASRQTSLVLISTLFLTLLAFIMSYYVLISTPSRKKNRRKLKSFFKHPW